MPSPATTPQIANSRCRITQFPNTTGTGSGALSVATLTAAMSSVEEVGRAVAPAAVECVKAERRYYRSSRAVNGGAQARSAASTRRLTELRPW